MAGSCVKIFFHLCFVLFVALTAGCSKTNNDISISTKPNGSTVTVTLSWDGPTSRMDGSALDPSADLSKYILYYGTSSRAYDHMVDIAAGTLPVSHSLELSSGTYYFAVTAVDASGQESDYSTEASQAI